MRKLFFGIVIWGMLLPGLIAAQTGVIQGRVVDQESNQGIPGANVIVEGTVLGAASDANGSYKIADVSAGEVAVAITVVGYEKVVKTVKVSPEKTVTVNFELKTSVLQMGASEVLASRASRETPVHILT